MGGLDLIAFIVRRNAEGGYERFLRDRGIHTLVSFPCTGTASQSVLNRLGLENADKTLLLTFIDRSRGKALLRESIRSMGLEVAGNGIGFLLPLESIGGKRAMNELLEGLDVNMNEVKKMDQTSYPYSMLVAITEGGSTDVVMDAAREAGARGGTVVHAKGTIGSMVRQFLGVSIAEEKEMVLILTSQKERPRLMEAIMEKAGLSSSAHTVLFSLPVDSVAGLRSIQTEEDAEAAT